MGYVVQICGIIPISVPSWKLQGGKWGTVCKQHYSLWGRHSFLVWLVGLVLGGVTQKVTGQDGSGVGQLQYRGDAWPPTTCSVLCGQWQLAAVTCGLRVLQVYGHSACGGIWEKENVQRFWEDGKRRLRFWICPILCIQRDDEVHKRGNRLQALNGSAALGVNLCFVEKCVDHHVDRVNDLDK